MATSFPIDFPRSPVPYPVRMRPSSAVSSSRSPFTGEAEVYVHQGQWWEMQCEFPPPMDREEAETIVAALLSLNGEEGTFLYGHPLEQEPRGSAGGAPLVDGGSQTGEDLDVDGAPASETGWLKRGDWVQLGTDTAARLHKVLEDVDTNASGEATLTLWPKILDAPSDNASVFVRDTVGLWRLAPGQWDWDVDRTLLYGLSFAAVSEV